jgi:hypothetical protein
LTVQLEVPSSTQRFIIGAKGATLKQIQNISGTRINVPKRETSEPTEIDDEDAEDVPVSITIVGDADGVKIAKAEILKIVGEKVNFTDKPHKLFADKFNSAISIDCNPDCQT